MCITSHITRGDWLGMGYWVRACHSVVSGSRTPPSELPSSPRKIRETLRLPYRAGKAQQAGCSASRRTLYQPCGVSPRQGFQLSRPLGPACRNWQGAII